MKANNHWVIAGTVSLMTFFLHLIGGQIDLVTPMMETSLGLEKRTQWLGVWHMVTVILILTSYVLLSAGLGKKYADNPELIRLIGYLNLAFCVPTIIASFYFGLLVPQWILFLPIGGFILLGLRRGEQEA
jgi:hypothetical protein